MQSMEKRRKKYENKYGKRNAIDACSNEHQLDCWSS
jgi:hypothetical protein